MLKNKMHYWLFFIFPLISACQMGYLIKNGYRQVELLNSRVSIEKVLKDSNVSDEVKKKLQLVKEVKIFAEEKLHLKKTKNYSTYVDLHRPYVTYVVSASPKNELKYYTWYFPIVGRVPYKGYFEEEGARRQAQGLSEEGYDTYVRGVTAYSSLGWFNDPVLSSMMGYSDYYLVNTIIHETVHATLYIPDNANFNERLATYLGDLGAKLFYEQRHSNELMAIEDAKIDDLDQKIFSEFISKEIKQLEEWYKLEQQTPTEELVKKREIQFNLIKEHYRTEVQPQLKGRRYRAFDKIELNNAKLMGYKLYMNDLGDFERLAQKLGGDFQKTLDYCKSLEREKNPEEVLKKYILQ